VKVSAPRMDGSFVGSVGLPLIVLAGRQLESDCREYFSSLLDIQVKKNDEVVGRNSGLDIIQAVNYLQNQTLVAFQAYLVGLTQDVGLSTKVASDISTRLTTGLFEPITAQIDPVRLAEMQRATEVAFEYGFRLSQHGKNVRSDGLQRLVNGYPSHGFVIDRKEAKTLFINVKKPLGFLAEFSQAVRDATESQINARQPAVQRFTLPLNLEGDANEPETASNAGTSAGGPAASKPAVNGDSPATPSDQQPNPPASDGAPATADESESVDQSGRQALG